MSDILGFRLDSNEHIVGKVESKDDESITLVDALQYTFTPVNNQLTINAMPINPLSGDQPSKVKLYKRFINMQFLLTENLLAEYKRFVSPIQIVSSL